MASPNHNPNNSNGRPLQLDPNTTFVQADPSNFRTIVQKLTGAPAQKPLPARFAAPRRSAFKLHERRQIGGRKLEIQLGASRMGFLVDDGVGSPVSTLELFGSPRTPMEEEEKAIAEKGFYLHPSPLSTPRSGSEPELLTLFPLTSPRAVEDSSSSCPN